MCTLGSNPNDFVKVYSGKVKSVSYKYDETQFKRISAQIIFKSGYVTIITEKALNIAPGNRIFFTANEVDGEWIVDEILEVKKPKKEKLTRADKQRSRILEAIG